VLVALAEARNADMVADNQLLFDAVAGRTVGIACQRGGRLELTFDDFLIGSDAYKTFNLGM